MSEDAVWLSAAKAPVGVRRQPERNGVGSPTRTALWAQGCTEAALAAGTKVRHWENPPEKVGCRRGAEAPGREAGELHGGGHSARRAFSSLGADRIHAPPVSPFSGDGPAVFAPGVYLLFLRRRHTSLTCRKRLGINISQEENAYEETHRFSAAGIGDGTEPGTHHCLGSREPRRPGSGHRGKHDLRKGRRRCLGWHAGGQVGGPGSRVHP